MDHDWEHRIKKIEKTTDDIHNEVNGFRSNMFDLKSDMKEIKLAFSGSDKIGLKGFAKRMNDVEDYITKDRKQKNMLYGGFTVLVFIWGLMKLFWNKIFGE